MCKINMCFLILMIVVQFYCISATMEIAKHDRSYNETITSKVRFLMWRRTNKNYEVEVPFNDLTNIKGLDDRAQVYIIFHGWKQHGKHDWILKLKENLLAIYNCTVLSVDYEELGSGVYKDSVQNMVKMASYSALYIDWLSQNMNVSLDKFHLIGFSLGAHAAGMASNWSTSGKVGRITGLDPASLSFKNNDTAFRLDKSDAHFVDAIHTHTFFTGLDFPVGHVDFYPNSGNKQPGCGDLLSDVMSSCSHARAAQYFVESTKSLTSKDPKFWSFRCPDYETYKKGLCFKSQKTEMGFNTKKTAEGLYFLDTNSKPPYAMGIPPIQYTL